MVQESDAKLVRGRGLWLPSLSVIAVVALVSGVLFGSVAAATSFGPAVVAVAFRGPSQGNILEITASVHSGVSLNHVNLSYSPAADAAFGAPVRMIFANYNSSAAVYNYTYQLSWTATYIRVQIVAVDQNGVQSQPLVTAVGWNQYSVPMSQPLFGGVLLGYIIAVLVAVGSLGAAVVLRWFLRARGP